MWLTAAAGPTDRNPLGDDPTKFDALLEAATLHSDVHFLQTVLAPDVRFTHGTGAVWDKIRWLQVAPSGRHFTERDLKSDEVELHGDVVETTGQIDIKTTDPKNPEYDISFVRLYERRKGRWELLSDRTIREVHASVPTK